MCGRLKPPLAEGAAQVRQGASLLKPSIHTHLDVTVDVPVDMRILIIRKLNNLVIFSVDLKAYLDLEKQHIETPLIMFAIFSALEGVST